MNEFIKKNRRMLEFYNFTAKIIGWVLIGITPFLIYSLILLRSQTRVDVHSFAYLLTIYNGIERYLFFGFILLGTSRFIRFLYADESQLGWILRNFEKFLYLYAVLIFIGIILACMDPSMRSNHVTLQEIGSYLLPQIISRTAQIFILIGLGHILRRILPVIEESKTLV